jgi:hypothetical protein
MTEVNMKVHTRMAALVTAAVLTLGTCSFAQYYDRGAYRGSGSQAQQYGYQSGYNDGVNKGRHEGRENDPYDYHTPDWRQATRGYQSWMGPLNVFQSGYQQGYAEGFRAGFASARPGWREGYQDYRRDGYPDYRNDYHPDSYRYDNNAGYSIGYQDGASVAREDVWKNKPFNPNPRGKYDDMDHGYRREFGDKHYYKSQYAAGYRTGYENSFRRRY